MNTNCNLIKNQAMGFASRAFKIGTDSWITAYGSEIIRLTAAQCMALDRQTGYTLNSNEMENVGEKIKRSFSI